MKYLEKKIILKDGAECTLRSPDENDAEKMIEYLRMTSGETYFMIRYPEEITMSADKEKEFLKRSLESSTELMIAAFINGELAGNCGISPVMNLKKLKHRAEFGISIKEKFWGRGIGNILLKEIIDMSR